MGTQGATPAGAGMGAARAPAHGHATLVITRADRDALGRPEPTVWFFLIWAASAGLWLQRQWVKFNFWMLSSPRGIRATRWIANFLRRIHPVPRGFGMVVPLNAKDLRDGLSRIEDLNGAEEMSPRLPAGEVVLAIDWPRRHTEERARLMYVLNCASVADDVRIRELARARCKSVLERHRLKPSKLNLARLCEDVALDVAQCYLGVGTTSKHERKHLSKIVRSLASQVFKAPAKHSREEIVARIASDRMRMLVEHCVVEARRTVATTPTAQQTVLQRMLMLLENPNAPDWLDEDWVIRNITTLTVFGSVTSARAMTQALRQLLICTDRTDAAKLAAQTYADLDPEKYDPCTAPIDQREAIDAARLALRLIVFEAMRFHPMLSMLGSRTALRDTVIAAGTPRMTRVKAGTRMLPLLLGAMNDPETFEHPESFCPHKRAPQDHLHFGAGPHKCVGRRMAEIQMEEIAAAFFGDPICEKPNLCCGDIRYKGPAVLDLRLTWRRA